MEFSSRSLRTVAVYVSMVGAVSLLCWLGPVPLLAVSTINYVQGNYATPQSPQTSVTVTFTAAQVADDLNVVAVGWNDRTATVGTVTDRSGIAENRMVTATGSYSATAPVFPSNPWIMQLIAFRTPSGGGTAPTVTGISPNSGPTAGGTAVTITGTNFATGATVSFGGTAATNVVVVSSTSITATTPAKPHKERGNNRDLRGGAKRWSIGMHEEYQADWQNFVFVSETAVRSRVNRKLYSVGLFLYVSHSTGQVSIWRSNSEKRGWILEREFRLDEFDLESYARDRGCLKLHERLKPWSEAKQRGMVVDHHGELGVAASG
jgi:hypothetical protein